MESLKPNLTPPALAPYGLTREMLVNVASATRRCMVEFRRTFIEKYEIDISRKLTSELLGKVFETECAREFSKALGYKVERERKDRDPDLWFTEIEKPLEVKVTRTRGEWRGGEFSKRPSPHLFVAWEGDELFDHYFVCLAEISEADWTHGMGKRYYATRMTATALNGVPTKQILIGSIETSRLGKSKTSTEAVGE